MKHEPAHAERPGGGPATSGASGAAERAVLADALPGYEIGGELGRGSCGIVLTGHHRELGREVAIKRLPRLLGADPELRARFRAEARLLSSLDHPHIVRMYDFVEVNTMCALVMQRLNGGTVSDRLERGEISPRAACAVTLATCSALQYAHAKGVLHRDIKPQNLMFSHEGVLKVTDFGIAKVLGDPGDAATETGYVFGTPAYIAPEHAQGAPPSPAIDIYAAAVALYVLLCGRLPFPPASDAMTELYQHVHNEAVPLLERDPNAPGALDDVIARALARDPEDRYPTARHLAVAVSHAAADAWGPAWAAHTGVVLLGAIPAMDARAAAPPRRDFDHEQRVMAPGDAFYVAGVDEELVNHLYQELAALGRQDRSPSRLRALCRLAIELHVAGAPVEHSRPVIAEAEEIASGLQEPAEDLVLLYSELTATWSPDDLPGRLARADELIARAHEIDAMDMAFRARRLRLRALLEAGDEAAADSEIDALDEAAAGLGGAWHRWQAMLYQATRVLRDGQAEEARPLMAAALELGQTVEPDIARRCFDDQATRRRLLAGAERELIPGMRDAAESCPWLVVRQAALAFGFVTLGRKTEALIQFEDLAQDAFASVPRDANWLPTMVLLSLACSRLGDPSRAQLLHDALVPYRDRVAVTGDCTVTWGPVAAALEALAPVL